MPTQELVLPALKPADWEGRTRVICRTLVPASQVPDSPWLAFGYDRPHTFEFLTRNDPQQEIGAAQLGLLEQAALRNLRARPATWQLRELRLKDGYLLPLAVCEDDFLSSERIMDADFMGEALRLLSAARLAVGIPQRGQLLAVDAAQPSAVLMQFATLVSIQFHQSQSAPISPLVFLHAEGAIYGVIRDAQDIGRQAAEQQTGQEAPFVSLMITREPDSGLEALHILAGSPNMAALGRAVQTAFVRKIIHLQASGKFGGEVRVVIIPDLTPQTDSLQADLESLRAHLQGIANELRLELPGDRKVQISVERGQEGNAGAGSATPTVEARPLEPPLRPVVLNPRDRASLLHGLYSDQTEAQLKAAEFLGDLGDVETIEPLIDALSRSEPQVDRAIAQALVKLGTPAVEALLQKYVGFNIPSRLAALYVLHETGDPRAATLVQAALDDQNASVRTAAVSYLGRLGGPQALKPLLSALLDEDPHVQAAAASSLGQVGDARAVPLLAYCMQHAGHPALKDVFRKTLQGFQYDDAAVAASLPQVEQWAEAERRKRKTASMRSNLDAARAGQVTHLAGLARQMPAELHSELLAAARAMRWGPDRIRNLVQLVSQLPEPLATQAFEQALAAAREYAGEEQGAEAPRILINAVAHAGLPAERVATVVEQALALAQDIAARDPGNLKWERAVINLGQIERPAVSPEIADRLFSTAWQAAARVKDAGQRATALADLVRRRPDIAARKQIVKEALDAALLIESTGRRAEKLQSLALALPDDLKREILTLARALPDIGQRAETMSHLAAYLPDWIKGDAIQEALGLTSRIPDRLGRIEVLSQLAQYLPRTRLNALLGEIRRIGNMEERAITLSGVGRKLPDEIQIPLLREAIDIAFKIADERAAHNALSLLTVDSLIVLRGSVDDLLCGQEGLQARQAAWKALGWTWREMLRQTAFSTLRYAAARHMPDGLGRASVLSMVSLEYLAKEKLQILEQAVAAARNVEQPWKRARILVALAWYFPSYEQKRKNELLSEAMAGVQQIDNDALCMDLKRDLFHAGVRGPQLSKYLETIVGALQLLEADPPDRKGLALVWVALDAVAQMETAARNKALQEATRAALAIPDPWMRARALNGLTQHFPAQLKSEALTASRALPDKRERADALRSLAANLPPNKRGDVLKEALSAARAILDPAGRIGALGKLTAVLPARDREQIGREALTEVSRLTEDNRRLALGPLFEYLPKSLHSAAFALVRGLPDEVGRLEVLGKITVHLDDALKPAAVELVQQCKDAGRRSLALAGMLQHLPGHMRGEVLRAALDAALSLEDAGQKAAALQGMLQGLPAELKLAVAHHALDAIKGLPDSRERLQHLESLLKSAPGELQMEIAYELESARAQTENSAGAGGAGGPAWP